MINALVILFLFSPDQGGVKGYMNCWTKETISAAQCGPMQEELTRQKQKQNIFSKAKKGVICPPSCSVITELEH